MLVEFRESLLIYQGSTYRLLLLVVALALYPLPKSVLGGRRPGYQQSLLALFAGPRLLSCLQNMALWPSSLVPSSFLHCGYRIHRLND